MRSISFVLVLVVNSAAMAQTFEGEWRCVGLVIGGQKEKRSSFAKLRLTVEKDRWKEHANEQELQSFKFKLHGDGMIEFVADGVTMLGRYELKDGVLRVCYPGPLEVGKPPEPPATIESAPGSKTILSEWRRLE